MKPYYKRIPPLTSEEVNAISKYQDLQSKYTPHSDWEFNFPPNKTTGKDSFMINNYYRGRISPTKKDVIMIEYYANLINSAIHKSYLTKPITLYRGYTNPQRMIDLVTRDNKTKEMFGRSFWEASFVSLTDDVDVAYRYATKNPKVKYPVISVCTYPPKTPMIYLDDKENEWLLPPSGYAIVKLDTEKMHDKEAIIYYIKKVQ